MSTDLETLAAEIESLKNELSLAQKEIHDIRIAKDNFISNLSYELRTPMNSVLGFSHFLLDTALDPAQQENIEDLCTASNALIDTINAIIDFTNMEAGDFKIKSIGFHLKNVIDRTLKDVLPLLQKAHISLSEPNMYWEDLENINGDPNRLKQVLVNIITTAIEHTKSDALHFDIAIGSDQDGHTTLRFEILDPKTILAESIIEAMFLKFSDHDTTNHSLYACSGIGLAIAENLVRLMHGHIGIDSNESGSLYWFEIPLTHIEKPDTQSASSIAVNKNSSILIAEDNPLNQKMILRLLKKEGFHTIFIANNGQEAIDIVQNNTIDIVFMDMQMPQVNGLEATQHIRSLDSAKASVPIIALTANALECDIQNCFQAGMNDHIAKPIIVDDLLLTLKKWANGSYV